MVIDFLVIPFSFCSHAHSRRHVAVCHCVALMRARKLVRGLRHELSEEERFLVADDVVHQLQQHGDP
jgi:hypothetical protein